MTMNDKIVGLVRVLDDWLEVSADEVLAAEGGGGVVATFEVKVLLRGDFRKVVLVRKAAYEDVALFARASSMDKAA